MVSCWRANKPQSNLWDSPSAKLFLRLFDRRCLVRWLAEAAGHGDFLECHVRFNNPRVQPRLAFAACLFLEATSSGTPSPSLNNPLAGRLDPRALLYSYQLFEDRKPQLEFYGSVREHPTPSLLFLTHDCAISNDVQS